MLCYFHEIFTECVLMYMNMFCKDLQQYSQHSFFDEILKTSRKPFSVILRDV